MELTSSHKYIKNTSTYITFLTENQLGTGRRSLLQLKLQERSPYNQIDRTNGKKLPGLDWHSWERALKEGRNVHVGRSLPWGATLPAGRSTGMDRAARKTGGAWTLLVSSMHMMACQQQRQRYWCWQLLPDRMSLSKACSRQDRALKGERALSNPTLKMFTLTTVEQILSQTGL